MKSAWVCSAAVLISYAERSLESAVWVSISTGSISPVAALPTKAKGCRDSPFSRNPLALLISGRTSFRLGLGQGAHGLFSRMALATAYSFSSPVPVSAFGSKLLTPACIRHSRLRALNSPGMLLRV